jgi:hypothetical protein
VNFRYRSSSNRTARRRLTRAVTLLFPAGKQLDAVTRAALAGPVRAMPPAAPHVWARTQRRCPAYCELHELLSCGFVIGNETDGAFHGRVHSRYYPGFNPERDGAQ